MSTLIPRALLGLTVLILCSPVSANPGVDWLQSRLQADGSFQDTENTVTPFQATAEVLRAFDIAGVTMSIDTTASLQFIDNEPYNNTENLARKIIANVQAGNTSAALISQLMLHQNRDGSFGERAGYDGTVLDTAFALEALAIAGQETGEAVGYAVGFLQTAQQSDGSWRLRNNDSSLYLTAVAMRAIWHYRHRFLLDQTLVKARDYLLNQRNAAGTWGQTFETALALIAVAPLLSDTGELDNSIQALAQSQQSDGSFGGVYQTALALRALQLAEHGNPDLGQITGRIIDGETGIGLADVGIALSGSKNAVSSSDVNGDFHFSGLPAGVYNLEITLDGYGPITAETMLVNGETKDLAIIRLLKQPDNTTAVLRGTVTAATNGNPVVGASVAVSGNASASVLTDENGEFFISGLPAGPVTVSVNADGFEPSSHSIALQAGATTLINIGLNVESPPTFSVAGIVTAQDTGEVLPGATVTVSGAANASTTTANDGSYNLSGLMPGAVTISATTDGYRSASVVITAQDRQALIFSPGLVPNDSPEEHPELGGIRGTVIDGTTGAAIVGATVALTADGVTRTFTTNTSGQFQAADVPAGMATLDLTTSGYQPNNRNFEIVAGLTVDLGEIPLTPADFVPLTGATGTVVDSLSNRPIAGARIEISVGSWTFVRLDGVYTKPVVVAGPLTHNNDRSLSVRVRNVTPTSFEIAMLSPC